MKELTAYLKVGSECRVKNRIYFLNRTFNGLFYLDMEDFTIHYVHRFSAEKQTRDNLSLTRSIVYKNIVYFFPCNGAGFIMGYDIERGQEELIRVPVIQNSPLDVVEVMQQENKIYLFPSDFSRGIYIFDLNKRSVTKEEKLSSLFKSRLVCSNDVIAFGNNCMLIGIEGTNEIIEVDLENKRIVKSIKLEADIKIYSINFDGNHYWILQTESEDIYEWDKERNILQIYTCEQIRGESNTGRPYSNIVFSEDKIFVLCFSKESVLHINKLNRTVDNLTAIPKGFQCVNKKCVGTAMFGHYTETEKKVFLFPGRGNMVLIYDKTDGKMIGKEFIISEKDVPYLREVQNEIFLSKSLHVEDDDLETLEGYMYAVEVNEDKNNVEKKKMVGGLILQTCLA